MGGCSDAQYIRLINLSNKTLSINRGSDVWWEAIVTLVPVAASEARPYLGLFQVGILLHELLLPITRKCHRQL